MKPWRRWQDWLNVVMGLWLVLAPWVLGYSTSATSVWNARIVGIIIILIALWAMATPDTLNIEWLNVVAGAYLLISSFWMDRGMTVAFTNHLIVGLAVGILAYWARSATEDLRSKAG